MNLIKDRTQEIKKELAELHSTLKMSVKKAIRIGQLLTEQKDFLGHGNFLPWLGANLDISVSTAEKYMGLSQHQDKIVLSTNLQEAYKQIETLEAQEKQSKKERERSMIAEFRKTGVKPAGWTKELDARMKKDDKAFAKQQERIEKAKDDREQRAQEHKQEPANDLLADELKKAAESILAQTKERETWKEKIRLSDGGKENAFLDAIIEYLETLPDDNRRIEACNNIIKICRNISVELQKQGRRK